MLRITNPQTKITLDYKSANKNYAGLQIQRDKGRDKSEKVRRSKAFPFPHL